MKFQLQALLSKNLFEFTIGQKQFIHWWNTSSKLTWGIFKGILNLGILILRFVFLQPRMVRQIGPNHFEEVNQHNHGTGRFYV